MNLGSPFDALHGAIASAVHHDIPEITYQDRDWEAYKGMTGPEQVAAVKNHTVPMVLLHQTDTPRYTLGRPIPGSYPDASVIFV